MIRCFFSYEKTIINISIYKLKQAQHGISMKSKDATRDSGEKKHRKIWRAKVFGAVQGARYAYVTLALGALQGAPQNLCVCVCVCVFFSSLEVGST